MSEQGQDCLSGREDYDPTSSVFKQRTTKVDFWAWQEGAFPGSFFLTLPVFILGSPCFIIGKDLLRPCLGCRTLFPQRLVFAMVRTKKRRKVTGSMEHGTRNVRDSPTSCLSLVSFAWPNSSSPTAKSTPNPNQLNSTQPKKAFFHGLSPFFHLPLLTTS